MWRRILATLEHNLKLSALLVDFIEDFDEEISYECEFHSTPDEGKFFFSQNTLHLVVCLSLQIFHRLFLDTRF